MIRPLPALAAAVLLLTASAAHAAALAPPAEVLEQSGALALPDGWQMLSLIGLLGGLFALIALMPRFDGDWDPGEGDDERRP